MAKEVDNVTAQATANMPESMKELVAKATKSEPIGEVQDVRPAMPAPEEPVKRTRIVDKEKNELKKKVAELEGKLATLQNAYNGKCQECLEAQNKYSDLARKADAVAKAVQANIEAFYGNIELIIKKGVL